MAIEQPIYDEYFSTFMVYINQEFRLSSKGVCH